MAMWNALRSDAAVYRRLRYPRSHGIWTSIALWLRPGGLLVLFAQRLGRTVRMSSSAGSPWTLPLLLMRIVQQCATYASVMFAKCDVLSSVEIEPGVYLADGGYLIIGARRIGAGTIIHHRVTIGMNLADQGRPTLGANVWIGPDTVIYGNVTIGDGATILPGTVLTKSIPGGTVVQGNPARVVRTGFDNAPLRSSAAWNIDAASLPSPPPRLPSTQPVTAQAKSA
jgi:serine acetyltransferase